MQFDWQTVIALGCVLAATVALVQRIMQWLRGSASACHGCPSKCSTKESTLVSIGMSPRMQESRSTLRVEGATKTAGKPNQIQ